MSDSSSKHGHDSQGSGASRDSLVQTILLEQYRLLLARQTTLPILNRVMSFVTIAFVAISTHSSVVQLSAAVLVSTVISFIWLNERRLVSRQVQKLAYDLAQQSGDEEEDFYIRSQYEFRRLVQKPIQLLTSYEPYLWLALTIILAVWQFVWGGIVK